MITAAIPDVFLGAFDSRATLVDTKTGVSELSPCELCPPTSCVAIAAPGHLRRWRLHQPRCVSAANLTLNSLNLPQVTVPTGDAVFILTSNYGAEDVVAEQEGLLDSDPATVLAARTSVAKAVSLRFESPSSR